MKKSILSLLLLSLAISSCNPNKKGISEAEIEQKADSLMKADENKMQEEQVENLTIWNYSSSKDEMTSKETKRADLLSTNHINLDFPYEGGTWGSIAVRTTGEELDMYFGSSNGQILTDYQNPVFRVRFDDEEPFYTPVSETDANDNNIRFFNEPKQLLGFLKSHKKMKVEVVFYDQGTYVFEFNIANLKM